MVNTLLWVLDNPKAAKSLNFTDLCICSDNEQDTENLRNFYNQLRPHCSNGLPSKEQILHLFNNQSNDFRDYLSSLLDSYHEYITLNTPATIYSKVEKMMVESVWNSTYSTFKNFVPEKYSTPDTLLSQLKKSFSENVASMNEPKFATYYDFDSDDLWNFLTERKIPTDWNGINRMLGGGLRCGTFGGFICQTGRGKSTILHNLATQMIRNGRQVAYINLEMERADLSSLIACPLSPSIDSVWWMRQNPVEAKRRFMSDNATSDNGHIFFIHKNLRRGETITPNEMRDTLLEEEEMRCIKFDVVLIDYLFLMEPDNDDNVESFVSQEIVAQRIHEIASDTGWAIVTMWQKNRPSKDKVKGFSTVAGSYNSSFKVDWLCDVNREDGSDVSEITCLKLRHGGDPDVKVFLQYESRKSQLIEVEGEDAGGKTLSEIVDLPYIHDNLSQADIVSLIDKWRDELCIDVPRDEKKIADRICKRVNYKKYKNIRGFESKIDWNSIDLPSLLKAPVKAPVIGLPCPGVITGQDLFC